jgi:hypothetical protein
MLVGHARVSNPFTSFSQGVALFSFNSVHTFLGASSGFCIGHAKHIISHHSSIYSAVSWDGFTESWDMVAFLYLFNLIESFGSAFKSLDILLLGLLSEVGKMRILGSIA